MMLVLYILGLPSPCHPPSLFFKSFRITQTRLMVLSIIHGLRPNPKLKAILEGCANLDHLRGLSLTSHYLFSKDFFLPNCVYIRFTHITNTQPTFFILCLPYTMSWAGGTVVPKNIFNSATTSWCKLNWPFGTSVNIRTCASGPQSLFLSVVLIIDASNLRSSKSGNLD